MRSHCVSFNCVPKKFCNDRSFFEIPITMARSRYISSFLNEIEDNERGGNFALWPELLVEMNQASPWLSKFPKYYRIFRPKLRGVDHQRLCRWPRQIRGIHPSCPNLHQTSTPNGRGLMPRRQKPTLPSSISPRSSTTIVYVYCISNINRHNRHGHTSFLWNHGTTICFKHITCFPLFLFRGCGFWFRARALAFPSFRLQSYPSSRRHRLSWRTLSSANSSEFTDVAFIRWTCMMATTRICWSSLQTRPRDSVK